MKILFCITILKHGKGGHVFSLRTIAEELAGEHDVLVVNLGRFASPAYTEGKYRLDFVPYHGWDCLIAAARLRRIIRDFRPDVVHAFDVPSYGIARLVTGIESKLVMTKCGGPNPNKYFPKVQNLILFSQENYVFFTKKPRWRNAHLTLIANRVREIVPDLERIAELKKKHGIRPDEKIVLRISRICEHYRSSIVQGIHLTAFLNRHGIRTRLLLLGVIQTPAVKTQLQDLVRELGAQDRVIWEDDRRFTDNAAELLPIADAVIGSGRNFMEAASFNKPLLAIAAEGDYPIYVDETSFPAVFATNCSPRTVVPGVNAEENLQALVSVLNAGGKVNSRQWFDNFFAVEKVRNLYLDFYRSCRASRKHDLVDAIENVLYAARGFL